MKTADMILLCLVESMYRIQEREQRNIVTHVAISTCNAREIYYSAIYLRYTELRSNLVYKEVTNPAPCNKCSRAD